MWRRVDLVSRDDLDGLMTMERADADRVDPPLEVTMTRSAWDEAIEEYYAEHDTVGIDGDARGPDLLAIEKGTRRWPVRQTIADPAGDHDWVIEAEVDLDASDEVGELVITTTAMRRL